MSSLSNTVIFRATRKSGPWACGSEMCVLLLSMAKRSLWLCDVRSSERSAHKLSMATSTSECLWFRRRHRRTFRKEERGAGHRLCPSASSPRRAVPARPNARLLRTQRAVEVARLAVPIDERTRHSWGPFAATAADPSHPGSGSPVRRVPTVCVRRPGCRCRRFESRRAVTRRATSLASTSVLAASSNHNQKGCGAHQRAPPKLRSSR